MKRALIIGALLKFIVYSLESVVSLEFKRFKGLKV